MKVLVDYDKVSGNLTFEDGSTHYTVPNINVTEHQQNGDIVEMLKLGASPDDIIKLKHNGVIK